jgi:hypothetical protein
MGKILKLAQEISKPEYQGLTESEIISILYDKNITVLRETMITDRTMFGALGSVKAVPIKLALDSTTDHTLQWAWEMMKTKGIDIALDESRYLIQSLVDNPDFPLVQEDADIILAMAEYNISKAEELEIGNVNGQDIRSAWEVM